VPKITKVYTRGGDRGETSLGGGGRVPKSAPRIEAFGTVDELNSQIGLAIAAGLDREIADLLTAAQNDLFHLGSDLCFPEDDKVERPVPRIEERHVHALEAAIDRMTAELGPLANFILPGGSTAAAQLHVARTVCRRAEREVVRLAAEERIGEWTVPYLNRLSDALFVMARLENHRRGVSDPLWDSRR
jgi:cob(I)alamin adenosyltransferase